MTNLCMGCMNQLPEGAHECPKCKLSLDAQNPDSALKIKTKLQDRYIVGKVLSQNGEGFSYMGYDTELEAPVKIREFCPAGIATRTLGAVSPSAGKEEAFGAGVQRFLELARALARMRGLSAIFPVYDIFEENGTAYYISETKENITLRDFLLRNGGALTYDQARPLFMPIMSTLSSLHSIGIYHRGISPETLVICKDGKLRLTEFAIADVRTAGTDYTPQLLKGYAALEQYGFDGDQGPWTDIYGLAATIYRTIVGNPPPEATSRVTNDKLIMPPSVAENLPAYVMEGLINAMAILPQERTKSVDAFRDELSAAPNVVSKQNQVKKQAQKNPAPKKKDRIPLVFTIIAILVALGILISLFVFVIKPLFDSDNEEQPITKPQYIEEVTTNNYENEYIDATEGTVPNLVGKDYANLISSDDQSVNNMLQFYDEIIISSKRYDDKIPAGVIISQEPKEGATSHEGDNIKVVVSLGPKFIEMPDVEGQTEEQAKLLLCESGIRYQNINVVTRYNPSAKPKAVFRVEFEGTDDKLSVDQVITLYVNSMEEKTTKPKTTKASTAPPTVATTPAPTAAPTQAPTTPAPTTPATTQGTTPAVSVW